MSPAPSSIREVLAALGVGALLVACCALPVLLAAGALGALGGVLSNSWLLAASGVLVVAAVVVAVARHRRAARRRDAAHDPDRRPRGPREDAADSQAARETRKGVNR